MKKKTFLGIIVAIAMVMASCTQKPQNEETPLEGTLLTQVKTPEGALGLKSGAAVVMVPTTDCKAFSVMNGFVVADFGVEKKLINPETGKKIASGIGVEANEGFFEIPQAQGKVSLLYLPATKKKFGATEYAFGQEFLITKYRGDIAIYSFDHQEILSPTNKYSKIAILSVDELLVFDKKAWMLASVKDKAVKPGKKLKAKDLQKYQAMTGWSEEATVMVLKK